MLKPVEEDGGGQKEADDLEAEDEKIRAEGDAEMPDHPFELAQDDGRQHSPRQGAGEDPDHEQILQREAPPTVLAGAPCAIHIVHERLEETRALQSRPSTAKDPTPRRDLMMPRIVWWTRSCLSLSTRT